MQETTQPSKHQVRIGTDVALALIVLCLLLPNLFGLLGATAPAKLALLALYIATVGALAALALAGRTAIGGAELSFALFAVPYTLVLLVKGGGLADAAYMATIVMTVTVAAHLRSVRGFFVALATLSAVFVVLSLGHWLVAGDEHYRGLTNNKNDLGTILFFCFVGVVWMLRHPHTAVDRLTYFYAALGCLGLTYLTSSRAALLTLLAFLFFYATWRFWSASRTRYILALTIVLLGSLLLVPVYVYLSYSPYAASINELSVALSGHEFFTGRHYVWPAHLLLISQAPLWGHGFDTESLALLKIAAGLSEHYSGLSAHNLYIMILTQTGLIGLTAFLILVLGLWHLTYERRHSAMAPVVGAMILAYLLHEIFEVSLVQNNLIDAWLFWLIVGLGLRKTSNRARTAPD